VILATPVASVLIVVVASCALPPTLNVTGRSAGGSTHRHDNVAVTVHDDVPSAGTVVPVVGLADKATVGGGKAPIPLLLNVTDDDPVTPPLVARTPAGDGSAP